MTRRRRPSQEQPDKTTKRMKLIRVSLTLPIFIAFERADAFAEEAKAAESAGDRDLADELRTMVAELWAAIDEDGPQQWRQELADRRFEAVIADLTLPLDVAVREHEGLLACAKAVEQNGDRGIAGELRIAADELKSAIDEEAMSRRSAADDMGIAGTIAGYTGADGYRYVEVDGEEIRADYAIFLMRTGNWPVHGLVHLNGDKLDCRPENLVDAPEHEHHELTSSADDTKG